MNESEAKSFVMDVIDFEINFLGEEAPLKGLVKGPDPSLGVEIFKIGIHHIHYCLANRLKFSPFNIKFGSARSTTAIELSDRFWRFNKPLLESTERPKISSYVRL